MLDHFNADAGVERPLEIGDGSDMVVWAATAHPLRRREAFDAMYSFGQARNQFGQSVQRRKSRAGADVQRSSDRGAGHSQRFGHSHNSRAEGPLARRGNLMLPVAVAVVLDRTPTRQPPGNQGVQKMIRTCGI